MMTSYLLSRTLVPTMVHYLLGAELTSTRDEDAHEHEAGHLLAGPRALQRPLRAAPPRLRRLPRLGARPQAELVRSASASSSLASLASLFPNLGTRLLPLRRRRADPPARPRAARDADRDDRADVRRASRILVREVIPPDELETMIDNVGLPDQRASTSRSATRRSSRRPTGRCSSSSRRSTTPTPELREGAPAPVSASSCPTRRLLPRSRHHHAGPELRADRAHRRAGGWPAHEQRRRTTPSPRASADESRTSAGAVDVHLAQVVNQPELRMDVDRDAREPAGADAERRRERRARVAQLERPGRAELLARYQEGRAVPRRGADAAVQGRHHGRAAGDARAPADERVAAAAGEPGDAPPRRHAGQHHALQRALHVRRAGQRPGDGPRLGRRTPSTPSSRRRRRPCRAGRASWSAVRSRA